MTIEFSLRRRATQARCLAILWLSLAVVILVTTYFSLPIVADKTLSSLSKVELQTTGVKSTVSSDPADAKAFFRVQLYAMGTLVLGLFAISFACFLLGRSAFVEMELAARFGGFADALCIAGDDFDQLEKAANLLMPSTKYLSVPEIFSTNDLKSVVDVVKELRPK
jgi:hypothetical protein